jgi:Tfp pilus assembly protein PilN
LLERLELATPEGIALSALTPDMKSGAIKIEGRARNFAHIRLYLDRLEDSKFFSSILLLSHSNITAGERAKAVQFSISCKAAPQ